jgi:hypothetical protein
MKFVIFDILNSLADMYDKSYVLFIKHRRFYLSLITTTPIHIHYMTNTKSLAINGFVFMVPIMAILYSGAIVNSGSQDNGNDNNSKKIVGCDNNNNNNNNNSIRTQLFASEIVPKYIIGKDYKIIPVDPATTDVFVNGCTLEARANSQ